MRNDCQQAPRRFLPGRQAGWWASLIPLVFIPNKALNGNAGRWRTLNDMDAGLAPRSTMPEYDLPETGRNLNAAIWILTLAIFVVLITAAFYFLAL
jgi:hypothetical protein